MGHGRRRHHRTATGGVVRIQMSPPDRLWLIATHHGAGADSERIWDSYASASRAPVARMNATSAHPGGNPSRPPAQLSLLGGAVSSIGAQAHAAGTTLVMMMHGVDDTTRSFGFLHSTGRAYMLDPAHLPDPGWSDRVLVIGWAERNRNTHYQAFVAAVRAVADVPRVHLYGCRLGGSMFRTGFLDFASDLGKEVWAYTGYTHTTSSRLRIIDRHEETAPSAAGATVTPTGYQRIVLESDNGSLLPGWQVRAYSDGGESRIDIFSSDSFGSRVDVHSRRTVDEAFSQPLRTVSL